MPTSRTRTPAAPVWPTKINVGCGYDKRPGHLNVDMDPGCQPDLLIEDNKFSQLPRRHFEVLVAHDVLEHIPRSQSLSALLEWADIMAMGGKLDLQTSNVIGIVELMRANRTFARHSVYTVFMFGNQAHPGDFHHTGFTNVTLPVLIAAAGFEVEILQEYDDWGFKVSATKAVNWTGLLDVDMSDDDFVHAAYAQALDRQPEDMFMPGEIALASTDRRGLLKKLFSSEERCLRVATRLGF